VRRGFALLSWGLLCIGVLASFNHLHQQLGEPRPVASSPSQVALFPTVKPAFSPLPEPVSPNPAIAIIIDDLGEQWQAGKRTIELPGAITLAILPFSTHGRSLAEIALQQGREVMLHAPMEPLSHPAWREGLMRGMTEVELRRELNRMLDALPPIHGVNNHMGSALTQERAAMDWVMAELAPRGLFFIDSRTTPASRALNAAQAHAIPSARRDIFLDNVRTEDAIAQQFRALLRLARERGQAIAIGHPYPETLNFLEKALADLDDVRLVPVSHLLNISTEAQTKRDVVVNRSIPSLSADTQQQPATLPTKSI
jgi:Uncharacterized protein conserved in bacteria